MKNEKHVIPIAALFNDRLGPNLSGGFDPRTEMADAEVIFAVDVMTEEEELLYGADTMRVISGVGRGRRVYTLCIALDQETDELEKLIGLVQATKGRDDYQNEGTLAHAWFFVRKGKVQRIRCVLKGHDMKVWPVAENHEDAMRYLKWQWARTVGGRDIRADRIGSVQGETFEGHIRLADEEGCKACACIRSWQDDGSPTWRVFPFD